MPRTVPAHVQKALRQSLRGELREPQLAELAQHFFDIAGGPREVAKLLHDQLKNAATPPTVKSRILDLILQATRYANSTRGVRDDLGLLNDDDLDRELEAAMKALPNDGPDQKTAGP